MKISKLAGALMLGCALTAPFAAQAQDVDWNDALTKSILKDQGVHVDDNAGRFLQSELYVQSERLSRSNVKVLKKVKLPYQDSLSPVDIEELSEYPAYLKAMEVTNPDGSVVTLLAELSPEEVRDLEIEAAGMSRNAIADEMQVMSGGLMMLGNALRQGIGNSNFHSMLGDESFVLKHMEAEHNDALCLNYLDAYNEANNDWQSTVTSSATFDMLMKGMIGDDLRLYPIAYTLGPACMLAASAEQLRQLDHASAREILENAEANARAAADGVAKIVGDEIVDGHKTKHIKVENVGMTQTMDDGSEVTINQMSFWLDPEYYVRRKIRMEGTIKRGRKSEPFFMERENQDYRRVGETYLYEPYKEVIKVGGIMSDKDKRELAKAQKELESAKKQLAQMPASQRAMMEGMFASQMAQLESLVNDGSATVTVITKEIEINPGFADSVITTFGGTTHSETLIRMIQADLDRLGFEPGPVTGKINKATSDAISAYQASRNVPVNGAPSPELAAALQAEVSGP